MPDIILPGSAGRIEARYQRQKAPGAPMALVLHPHPQFGGTMNNPLVYDLFHMFHGLGCTTVRFNFRGVGQSEGVFDHGNGERDDLLAVVAWISEQHPGDALWLAGFSFGAYVSLRATSEVQPDALISIAPPVGRWDFDSLVLPTCPWLVIQGDEDEIVDPQAVYDWIDTLKQKPELVRMPGTSHFFHRKLIDLRGALQHGVKHWLPTA
jgi:alpha/beta superfamily hydrolase